MKTISVNKPIKVITSGNVPTVSTLAKGELAFGVISGKARHFVNITGSAIVELTAKEYTALASGGITVSDKGEISISSGGVTAAMLATALAAKILFTDNTTAFTPAADYNPATKKYVDDKVSGLGSLLTLKGTKTTTANLPSTGNKTGDVWLVGPTANGEMEEWVWNSTAWEKLGTTTTVDLSGYYTKTEADALTFTASSNQPVSVGGTRGAVTTSITNNAVTSAGGLKVNNGKLELDTDNIQISFVTPEI
ncbi:MAG: hypothetical protein LBF81_06545 [Prevotellaceae bacterium]|jgi:hypothetical protein|nr:hypothetical protein [Prevotellaceae bacterium]